LPADQKKQDCEKDFQRVEMIEGESSKTERAVLLLEPNVKTTDSQYQEPNHDEPKLILPADQEKKDCEKNIQDCGKIPKQREQFLMTVVSLMLCFLGPLKTFTMKTFTLNFSKFNSKNLF
jgi:hypothetical protein